MIEEMGIMTFPEASVCWKKERSYVMQQHTKYPDKFLHRSIDKIGIGKGTWLITKKGMEHLTGKIEEQANKETWVVVVQQGTNIIDEKSCSSEAAAEELMKELVSKRVPESRVIQTINYTYLDHVNKRNYGVRLPGGVMIYCKQNA
ncbi:helix-turn-helix domain-containing protein [Enterococcus sp. BWR-S5]|uniref:helix-turn-helix domain-containing protein n=1 Tax=Enterococcus sp. BWR-S5 TaxID=2787714 RepID=UPI001924E71E|nr:helix-turn-helix domain-containing protein [Enterococcus sp. BWR-S5]MBL1227106.1 hypothetical protein [Enterococcus sp. BWR-S5]